MFVKDSCHRSEDDIHWFATRSLQRSDEFNRLQPLSGLGSFGYDVTGAPRDVTCARPASRAPARPLVDSEALHSSAPMFLPSFCSQSSPRRVFQLFSQADPYILSFYVCFLVPISTKQRINCYSVLTIDYVRYVQGNVNRCYLVLDFPSNFLE